jgi:ribosomal protein S18 acetylase RimI-like enzyme
MESLEFRRISESEREQAYSIICQRTEWLHSKRIKQWTEPLPREEFDKRQRDGDNYGLFVSGRLAVFLSLVKERLPYWDNETNQTEVWWLTTLATAIDFSGQRLGPMAVQKALERLRQNGQKSLYLDCERGNGFLSNYYGKLGFDIVAEKGILFPKCGLSHMVLMKHDL